MKQIVQVLVSVTFACVASAFATRPAWAQGGAAIVRIPDGPDTRCISAADDRVWLTLRRAIVDKKGGWLKENVSVYFLVTAQMRVQSGRPVSFPLMSDASVQGYSNGQVSVPVEFTFIDGLPLTQQTTTYSGATIDITILNQQAKTSWGSALTALAEMAKKLPLPNGPATDAVKYLMDFGVSALNKDTAKVDPKDKAKSATISMNFSPTAQCTGGFEETGTLAVLQDPPTPAPADAVKVSEIDNYCWSAQMSPAFVLKAARKESSAACTEVAHYRPLMHQVSNNYVGLVLSAIKSPNKLGPSDQRTKDLSAARLRCQANHLPVGACGVGR